MGYNSVESRADKIRSHDESDSAMEEEEGEEGGEDIEFWSWSSLESDLDSKYEAAKSKAKEWKSEAESKYDSLKSEASKKYDSLKSEVESKYDSFKSEAGHLKDQASKKWHEETQKWSNSSESEGQEGGEGEEGQEGGEDVEFFSWSSIKKGIASKFDSISKEASNYYNSVQSKADSNKKLRQEKKNY